MTLSDALREFAERELGSPLAQIERFGAGASRVTWLWLVGISPVIAPMPARLNRVTETAAIAARG